MENIRKIKSTDYESFKTMINEFRKTEFTQEEYVETIVKINKYTDIWVIEKKNEIVATGTILYETKFIHNIGLVGHIEDICVKEKYRKLGLGKKIILHLLQEAENKKCYKIILDCSEENKRFYENCGLEQKGIQMAFYYS